MILHAYLSTKRKNFFGLASLKSTVIITVVLGHDPYINYYTPVCLPYISYNHVIIIVVIGTVERELVLPVVLNDPIHSVLYLHSKTTCLMQPKTSTVCSCG